MATTRAASNTNGSPRPIPDFPLTSLRGQIIPLSHYQGKTILVVNTASKCGFTPQYAELEALYRKYEREDFVILGFPCNQLGKQEPGDADVIESTCLINYGVSFPIFEKIDVKGPSAHPLFVWLTSRLPGVFGQTVKWNFTKFLIGADGTPLRRFAPITRPSKFEGIIRSALKPSIKSS